ncbi:glutamine synthetase [Dongia mobilis]|uniref:Glutamine synthetase n=1 Tax=Dongia mobilis TaxID=578943 RepID=A0A4R6WQU8_9PROT|nr:glutamine synthetase family protein [Dongia mobilis]TDQ83846.1 glutamine synthetase [Dongia mobilis]
MQAGDVAYLAWSDYVGMLRCRGVPLSEIKSRMAHGLGWAVAGQALTPFDDIAPNPWGPMLEVRQVPVPETETRLAIWADTPPLHFFLCNSLLADGSPWDCCTRSFMTHALADFEQETGLRFMAAFEHEFLLRGETLKPTTPFSMTAMRLVPQFIADLANALTQAGVQPETIEPEYGIGQYEISTAPAVGAMAGDRCIITREVIREVARHHGLQASFTPKPAPDAVGNGAHVHFSFVDKAGGNGSYDPKGTGGAAAVAQKFIAGVVRYMPAICALVAPSPVSYFRLGPHHWSCGYASFGIQNREAAVRICPSPERDPAKQGKAFNMELRAPDATASPYMVIGALVRAGLEGIRQNLPLPAAIDRDPSELSDSERAQLGIKPLPGSLGEALDLLDAEPAVKGWMSPTFYDSYVAVKRKEIEMFAGTDPRDICRRYQDAY